MKGRPVSLSPEQDWPRIKDKSPAAWKRAQAGLREAHDALNRDVAVLPDERLEERIPGSETTLYGLLHGVVQHGLYHAGQIVILKKGLAT